MTLTTVTGHERASGHAAMPAYPGDGTGGFGALGVDDRLVLELAAGGLVDPFPVQALTIPDALAGHDVCASAKTGSGKTLAFGLPLLQRCGPGRRSAPSACVLVPIRELAIQVAEVLSPLGEAVGRRVALAYGGASIGAQTAALRAGAAVLVATPGRMIDLVERAALRLDGLEIVVVDEADRLADMGFLPQVEWLLSRAPKRRQTMLYSATLDGAALRLRRFLSDPVRREVGEQLPTVAEMRHRFLSVHELDKAKVAAAVVRGAAKTLVFTRTKRGADRLATRLRKEGVRVGAIHGDLPQPVRERALADFAAGRLEALVATDVAARGLDIEGVDVVVHYDPPEDYKAYLHRSGRTARAGEAGVAVTLVLWNEAPLVERVQRRLGLRAPFVEVFSNDPWLSDLEAFGTGDDAAEPSGSARSRAVPPRTRQRRGLGD